MQGIQITQPGGPEVLQPIELPKPEPAANQVLIRVVGAGVNRPDCLQRAGLYPVPADASPLPGLEVSGVIDQVGPGVGHYNVGDRVCALVHGGGYAEYCLAHEQHCLPVPDDLDLAGAGALPETLFTVFYNVYQRGQLQSGETLLVHGGSSGIGATAIQLAKLSGCHVATTAGSEEKCAFASELGADVAVNYREDDFVEVIGDRLGGVDVVLDMVGGSYIERNLALLRRDGRYVFIAFLGGAKAEISFLPLLRNRLTLTGSTLRPQSNAEKATIAQGILRDVWPWVTGGQFSTPIYASLALEEATKAHEIMESGRHMGKILLTTDFSG